MHYQETNLGFEWGSASVERCFSDDKKGWVTLLLATPKHKMFNGGEIQIYVTKTGKVRIHSSGGEWMPPNKKGTK